MSDKRMINLFDDLDAAAAATAESIRRAADNAVAERGRFSFVLAGGATPRRTYEILAKDAGFPWNETYFLFGDERMVPKFDAASNFTMAFETLFGPLKIPESNIIAPNMQYDAADDAARDYEERLRAFFGRTTPEAPQVDCTLLGMGVDSHTASLFPRSPALKESKRLVVGVDGSAGSPPVDRITMTLPMLNASRTVIVLTGGESKKAALKAILEEGKTGELYPAGMVETAEGPAWHVYEK